MHTIFESVATLRTGGFAGFASVAALLDTRLAAVPAAPGVYAIVRDTTHPPVFLPASPAGRLKGRDPSLPVAALEGAWVRNTCLLYLGKVGGAGTHATLRRRLSAYLRHGHGARAAHWGGRAIWQLADAADLLVAWRVLVDEEPRAAERASLAAFSDQYGQRPFANQTG
jgi:hypothetical protein